MYIAPVPRPGIKSGNTHMYAGKDSDEVKINIFRDLHQHFKGK